MKKTLYEPILNDDEHLVNSTENPDRVRGLSRDKNNQNPGIPEWKSLEVEIPDNSECLEESCITHLPVPMDEEEDSEEISKTLVAAAAIGGTILVGKVIIPWIKNTALPWLRNRKQAKNASFYEETSDDFGNIHVSDVSHQIDSVIDGFKYDMSAEETQYHIMNIIYHMLGIASELQILCNSRKREDYETDELYAKNQKALEDHLVKKVAAQLDCMLSDEKLCLNIDTAKEVWGLMNGGIRLNGEYIPVEIAKVSEAITRQQL